MARLYTKEEDAYITEHYPNEDCEVIAKYLDRTCNSIKKRASDLKVKKSKEYISNLYREHYYNNPNVQKHTFKKGDIPHNKGKKWDEWMKKEWLDNPSLYKKGNIPYSMKPIGAERINSYGYIQVKIALPNKWKLKHRIIWEEKYGEIPKGHDIHFRDGDRKNTNIDNLELVSKREVMDRYSIYRYPKELIRLIKLNNRVKRKINEKM